MPDYTSRAEVVIGGVTRRAYALSAIHGIGVGMATSSVTIDRGQGSVSPGDSVEIRMGLNNTLDWVFVGTINERGISFYPTYYEVSSSGQLKRARRKTNRRDAACMPPADPDLPTPDPIAYCASDKTDGAIVTELLALLGITNVDIDDAGLTLGTINPVQLPTGGSPWALIQAIDKLTWMRTFDAADGSVMRRPFTITGAADAAMTLTEGVDLFDGKTVQSSDQMVTNVHVRGASYVGIDDIPINVEFSTDNPEENEFGVSDVEEWQSDLIETEEVAEDWATTTLGELGKLQERVQFTLARGYTNLRGGMTVALVSPTFGYGGGSRFIAEEVRHYFDGVEFLTAATFRGSAEPTGSSANQRPIALIVYKIEREYLDGVRTDLVYFDGSGSYDLDGLIAAYAWDGSPVVPTPIGDGRRAVAVYSGGIPGGATVTLTVTDDQAREGVKTISVVASPATPVQVRPFWAAIESSLIHTQNGGKTWTVIAIEAVGVVHEADPSYTLAWDGDGALYRVLSDDTFLTKTPTAISAASIVYDDTGLFTGEAWAGGSNGKVWHSIDEGVTWVERGTIPGALAITSIQGMLGTPGGVEATAGTSLWDSFDTGGTFFVRRANLDAAAIATSFAAGFGAGVIGFAKSGGLSTGNLLERDNAHIYALPAGDVPAQIRAVTIGGESPFLVALGIDDAGAGGSWVLDDLSLGGALVRGAWDVTHGLPNDGIRDPRLDGLIYFAANDAIGKTPDYFGTVLKFKTLGGGENGLKLGYGPFIPEPPIPGALIWIGNVNSFGGTARVFALEDGVFTMRAVSPCDGQAGEQILLCPAPGILLCYSRRFPGTGTQRFFPGAVGNFFRSDDGGYTWVPVVGPTTVNYVYTHGDNYAYCVDWDGDAVIDDNAAIWRSTDAGLTWELRIVWSSIHPSPGNRQSPSQVLYDPADPDVVIARWEGMYLSTDGAATFGGTVWNGADITTSGFRANGLARWALDGSRIVYRWANDNAYISYPGASVGDPSGLESDVDPHFVDGASPEQMYAFGDFGVRVSDDSGATWGQWFDEDRAPVGIEDNLINGFVPRDGTNPGFVLPRHTGGHESYIASQSIAADPADVWIDLTPTFEADLPTYAGEAWCYIEGAVRLTGTE